jgi:hypothetical protein
MLTPFRLPTDPGANAVYICPIDPNNPGVVLDPAVPLMRMEQGTIDMMFARCKHYYQSLLNIKGACFTAPETSINVAFQVLMTHPSKDGTPGCPRWSSSTNCPSCMATPPQPFLNRMIRSSPALTQLPIPRKYSSGKSRIAPKLHFLVVIRTRTASSSITQSASS